MKKKIKEYKGIQKITFIVIGVFVLVYVNFYQRLLTESHLILLGCVRIIFIVITYMCELLEELLFGDRKQFDITRPYLYYFHCDYMDV